MGKFWLKAGIYCNNTDNLSYMGHYTVRGYSGLLTVALAIRSTPESV